MKKLRFTAIALVFAMLLGMMPAQAVETHINSDENLSQNIVFWSQVQEESVLETLNKPEVYYSSLPNNDKHTLLNSYSATDIELRTLESAGLTVEISKKYLMVRSSYALELNDVVRAADSFGSIETAATEIRRMTTFFDDTDLPDTTKASIKELVVSGLEFPDAQKAYVALQIMGKTPEECLVVKALWDDELIVYETDVSEHLDSVTLLAEQLSIDADVLRAYLSDNDIAETDFKAQIIDGIYELYGITSDAGSAGASSMAAAAGGGSVSPAESLISAPFTFDINDFGSVNINTSDYTFEEVDLYLPGKNGLDLILTRRYDSSDAQTYYPYTYIYDCDPSRPKVYTVKYEYYLLGDLSINPFQTHICDDTNRIPESDYYKYNFSDANIVDENNPNIVIAPMSSLTQEFYAWEREDALAYREFLEGLNYNWIFPSFHPNTGNNYIGAKAEIVVDESALVSFTDYIFTYPMQNEHMLNLYGLGNGWSYAFSSIEKRGVNTTSLDYTTVSYLRLADGRKFRMTPNGSTYILEGYKLTDMTLYSNGGGYPGASYYLRYADGKAEYFNSSGYLIAIKDRFDNAITFSYSSQGAYQNIEITDTLGRKVHLENNPNNPNQRLLTGPGVSKVFTKESVTYSGVFISYLNYSYTTLKSVKDTNGDMTTFYYDIFNIRFNSFSPNSINKDEKLRVPYLRQVNFPNGLRVAYGHYTSPRKRQLDGIGYEEYYLLAQVDVSITQEVPVKTVYCMQYYYTGRYAWPENNLLLGNVHKFSTKKIRYYYFLRDNDKVDLSQEEYYFNANQQTTAKEFRWNKSNVPVFKTTDPGYTEWKSGTDYKVVGKEDYLYDQYGLVSSKTEKTYDFTKPNATPMTRTFAYVHDAKGNTTRYTGPDGIPVYYTYDSANYNLLTERKYKRDAATEITEKYTLRLPDKKVVETVEVFENQTTLKQKTAFVYDGIGNVTKESRYKDANTVGNVVNYSYDDNQGRQGFNGAYLTKTLVGGVLNADGSPAEPTPGLTAGNTANEAYYDESGRPIKIFDANGNKTEYEYDILGNVSKIINPDETYTEYTCDYIANTLMVKDENGNRVKYMYNEAGKLTSVIDFETDAILKLYVYDSLLRVHEARVYSSETEYSSTIYIYDTYDQVLSAETRDQTGALLSREEYAYDYAAENGQYQKVTKTIVGDANATSIVTTSYTDKLGRVVKQGRFLSGTEYFDTYTYDYVGNLLTEKTARTAQEFPTAEYTKKWDYDYANRVVKEYNAYGNTASTVFNTLGQKTSFTDFKGYTSTYTYDNLSRLLSEKTPFELSGTTIRYSEKRNYYDPAGNVTLTKQTANIPGQTTSWNQTGYGYNERGFLKWISSYNGGSSPYSYTAYDYDAVGNMTEQYTGLTSSTPPAGSPHTFYAYDHLGRMTSLTDALGQTEEYIDHDLLGNVLTKRDRNGATTVNTYDALGRLLTTNITKDGSATGQASYNYTLTGAKRSESNEIVTITYAYDVLGRLDTVNESGGIVKSYTYDLADNRKSYKLIRNGSVQRNTSYKYDKANRLEIVSENNSQVASYAYDANGNRETMIEGPLTTSYSYNLANLVTSLTNKRGTTVLSTYSYTYYLDGNQRTKADNNSKVTTYTYDGLIRLTKEAESGATDALTLSYTYGRDNNRETMTVSGAESYTVGYAYDDNNRLLRTERTSGGEIETTYYRYDKNGNQISKLSETLSPAGSSSPGLSLTSGVASGFEVFAYDGFNRLTSANIGGVDTAYTYRPDGLRHSKITGGVTTTHVWDGSNISLDVIGGGVTKYIRGINLLASESSGTRQYYLYNAHGDVVQLTNSSGVVTKSYNYDAFGNERNPDDNDSNPWRYCGEYLDLETNTYYLRARYYDPATSRMLSEDPARDGLNWYTYCANNPIMWIDPSGLVIELQAAPKRGDYSTDAEYQNALRNYNIAVTEYDRAIEYLMQSNTFESLYNKLMGASEVFTIEFITDMRSGYDDKTYSILWNPTAGLVMSDGKAVTSAAMALAHEMGHGAQHLDGEHDAYFNAKTLGGKNRERKKVEEANVKKYETPIAKQLGEPTRKSYDSHKGSTRMNNSIHYRTMRYGVTIFHKYAIDHNQWPLAFPATISAAP